MELSKRIAYLKGLMAGLGISDSTPEGKVLLCMSDILEQMADEVEDNTRALTAVTDYIDELEEGGDPFDDIDTYEYGFDPEKGEGEYAGDGGFEDDEFYDFGETDDGEPDEDPGEALDEGSAENPVSEAQEEQFRRLLNNITSDPDYTDGDIDRFEEQSKLIEKLKTMMEQELDKAPAEPLAEEDEEPSDIDEDDVGDMIFGMKCPFCHEDITFTNKDIVNSEFECPVCGNKLTIMM